MPVIAIKSLPFATKLVISDVIKCISKDFSGHMGLDLEHITVTWEFFIPGNYSVGGVTANTQPADSHPVLVDLLAPDFNSKEQVVEMLKIVSTSISQQIQVQATNVFINYRQAHSGLVFDSGEVVHW